MKKKKIPKFKSEKEEAEFWNNHSPLDYQEEFTEVDERFELDPALLKKIAERQKERKRTLTFRIEPSKVYLAKIIARKRGSAYQSLIRMWINQKIQEELESDPEIKKEIRKEKEKHELSHK